MNKKAGMNELVMSNVIYIILAVVFVAGLGFWIFSQSNGAGLWGDFYAKEIAKTINLAEVGDEIELNVHAGSAIGIKNGIESFSSMFRFNGKENEVCVKLSRNMKSCYSYFNDVAVKDVKFVLAGSVGGKNILKFKIAEKREKLKDKGIGEKRLKYDN